MEGVGGGGPVDTVVVAIGHARLPASLGTPAPFLLELSLDTKTRRIVGVAASLPLPSFNGLLGSLLIGELVEDDGVLFDQCVKHIAGPLARPTAAAVTRAAAHARDLLAGLEKQRADPEAFAPKAEGD